MSAAILSDFRVLVAPGLHGSGPVHWQSRWQRLYPAFERVEQDDWAQPHLPTWSARLDQVRARDERPVLIVAHSFGALTAAHSVARDPRNVAGVLLVAPADPDKFGVAGLLPRQALSCPSIMIASSNDPWMTLAHAALWARRWDSEFIDVGQAGHINADSGLGDWVFGRRQLQKLAELAHNEQLCNVF
ncbi:MAG: alpha/beta hydrolase [Pseudomonadota bacterium]